MGKHISQILSKSKFTKNAITLMVGAGIAQVIPVIASIVLAYLYSPEEFGVLALYTSIITILGNIGVLRYETAIVLPRKDSDVRHLFLLCLIMLPFAVLLYLILFFLFDSAIVSFIEGRVGDVTWRYFIIPGVFFYTLYQVLNFWTNRKTRYKDLAKSRIIQSGTTAISNISIGLLGFTSFGLILGNILGQLTTNLFLLKQFRKYDLSSFKTMSKRRIFKLANLYSQFPLFATPSTVFNSISTVGLPILIALFYDAKIAGLYFFSMRVIRLPLNLMFSSFSQVYREQASKYYYSDKAYLLTFTRRIQFRMIMVMLPMLLLLSFIAPYLFSFVFGQEWREAGEYVKYFSIFIFLSGIYSPISSIGDVLMEQKAVLVFNIVLSFLQLSLFYFLHDYFDFKIVLLFVSVLCGGLYLTLDFYMKVVLKESR